jgi:hypothetical protein
MAHVTVADDLFDSQGEWDEWASGWQCSPAFLILTDQQEMSARALHVAGQRFRRVNELGVELEEWEDDEEGYTPDYVSPVLLTQQGPLLWMDMDGVLTKQMGVAMVRILTEELNRRGVSARVVAPPASLDFGDRLWKVASTYGSTSVMIPDDAPWAWFVCRTVARTTKTGKRYTDREYLRTDGSWTRDRGAAHPHVSSPDKVVEDQRRTQQNGRYGAVGALLLMVDPAYDSWALPPEDIRADD